MGRVAIDLVIFAKLLFQPVEISCTTIGSHNRELRTQGILKHESS
jgi:hypothetical protein